jgi:hypothetical protein
MLGSGGPEPAGLWPSLQSRFARRVRPLRIDGAASGAVGDVSRGRGDERAEAVVNFVLVMAVLGRTPTGPWQPSATRSSASSPHGTWQSPRTALTW